MSSRTSKFVDANVIIRFLTHDDPTKSPRCDRLFARINAQRETVEVSNIVIADVVRTLTKSIPMTALLIALMASLV